MPLARDAIEIDGVKALAREFRKAADKEVKKAIEQANKEAAEVVERKAERTTPRRSGDLARSIRAKASDTGAMTVGSHRIPYAGVIHWGWPARNIRPNKYLTKALKQSQRKMRQIYESAVDKISKSLS